MENSRLDAFLLETERRIWNGRKMPVEEEEKKNEGIASVLGIEEGEYGDAGPDHTNLFSVMWRQDNVIMIVW